MVEPVKPDEPLSRFLTTSRWFSRASNTVLTAAFMPSSEKRTSVFRTADMTDSEVWATSQRINVYRILGRGVLTVRDVTEVELGLDPNDDPPGHADIIGWPDELEARLQLAGDLALRARLEALPKPIPGARTVAESGSDAAR